MERQRLIALQGMSRAQFNYIRFTKAIHKLEKYRACAVDAITDAISYIGIFLISLVFFFAFAGFFSFVFPLGVMYRLFEIIAESTANKRQFAKETASGAFGGASNVFRWVGNILMCVFNCIRRLLGFVLQLLKLLFRALRLIVDALFAVLKGIYNWVKWLFDSLSSLFQSASGNVPQALNCLNAATFAATAYKSMSDDCIDNKVHTLPFLGLQSLALLSTLGLSQIKALASLLVMGGVAGLMCISAFDTPDVISANEPSHILAIDMYGETAGMLAAPLEVPGNSFFSFARSDFIAIIPSLVLMLQRSKV